MLILSTMLKSCRRLCVPRIRRRNLFLIGAATISDHQIPSCILVQRPIPYTSRFWPSLSISCRTFAADCASTIAELSLKEYDRIADETLESLDEYLEGLPDRHDCHPDFDVQYSQGVLTLTLGEPAGIYVVNRQSPNRQIWLSSPTSGPKRYDFTKSGQWVYLHDLTTLHQLLQHELREVFKTVEIDLSSCAHSK